MIAPTLFVAIKICWDTRKHLADLVHNAAVCFWIGANIVWMLGEFYLNDGTRGIAKVFFYCGMALLAAYYLHEGIARSKERNRTVILNLGDVSVSPLS